jgi:putative ATPase
LSWASGRPAGAVPAHLRDSHYRSAKKIGHGVGYQYPHDDPRGWLPQRYLPDEVKDRRYYEPSEHGSEREIGERLRRQRDD